MIWQIVSGEYPPAVGGVSAHTNVIAHALAARGDEVHVWSPSIGLDGYDPEIRLHKLADRFGLRSIYQLERDLTRRHDQQVIIQYVAQSFGKKGMNIPFCWWLWARRRLQFIVMFHEIMVPTERDAPLRHNVLALTTRFMASLVARVAKVVFISTPIWRSVLRDECRFSGESRWLPIPSPFAVSLDREAILKLRSSFAQKLGCSLFLGILSSYPESMRLRTASVLRKLLAQHRDLGVVLLGQNGHQLSREIFKMDPSSRKRLLTPGLLPDTLLSQHLSGCDLMLQIYPDGACARRTSLVAALAHARPVVSNKGKATEVFWASSGALALAADEDEVIEREVRECILGSGLRRLYSSAAAQMYAERFAVEHSLTLLRRASAAVASGRQDAVPMISRP